MSGIRCTLSCRPRAGHPRLGSGTQERPEWPGPVSAEAVPGRRIRSAAEASAKAASPAMTTVLPLLVQLLAALGHGIEERRGLAVEEVDIGRNEAAGRGV